MKICDKCQGKAIIDCATCKRIGADKPTSAGSRTPCLACSLWGEKDQRPCPACKGNGALFSGDDIIHIEQGLLASLELKAIKRAGVLGLVACSANGDILAQMACGLERELVSSLVGSIRRRNDNFHAVFDLGKRGVFSVASNDAGNLFLVTILKSPDSPIQDIYNAAAEVFSKQMAILNVSAGQEGQ